MNGVVKGIFIAREQGSPAEPQQTVEAVADCGLRGDRYFDDTGTFSGREIATDITLIEKEAITAVEREYTISLDPGVHRRNIVVEGVALNHFVDQPLTVGGATMVGHELCEPCSYLEQMLEQEGVCDALIHRGGLRGRIVDSGSIAVGDSVTPNE
ncbi:MOSC domain-containing protein [Natronocalculus amylovorans]|uniref:MOSC domain-containing protein n=1 Tax=Natronocalculus amylovorans TaxID=2917812 RepID=A0AAE3FZ37_9EURY|nr:MOSC domain-containing protein [Natronocalculus amylovorans]MCL9817959.1 MOSC domain-containing protein [Natronocalculus amylovorans]